MTISSLFISFLVKSFYATIHSFIFKNIIINDSLKVIIFSLTGLILALICTYVKHTYFITKILYRINNKSINNDIFDDIIDYDKRTMMNIYIKSSDIYYIGRFSFREENGIDSWISLVDYCSVNKKTEDKIFDPEESGLKSSIAINLNSIERIELIYEDDSEVWKRLSGSETDRNVNESEEKRN